MQHLNYFSEREKGFIGRFLIIRDRIFAPFVRVLNKIKISADILSYSGILVLIGFVLFVKSRPILAATFLLINVILDAMDGALARHTKTASNSGAFTDILCDHVSLFIVVATLLYYNLLIPVNALIYVFLYVLLITFTIIRNKLGITPKLVFRSKYYVFLLYGLWAFTKINLLDYFILLFNALMFISVLKDYKVLKIKLKEYG